MSSKRPRDDAPTKASSSGEKSAKRAKKGFSVGPDNLPDGQHRRKTQQIKRNLIEKAKIRKDYAKVKASASATQSDQRVYQPYDRASASPPPTAPLADPSTEPHPDRQTLMDEEAAAPAPVPAPSAPEPHQPGGRERGKRQRAPKTVPFAREYNDAQAAKAAAEARRAAREEAERQRGIKLEERERFRRAMAKARTGGKNGQRKLGRESGVLLEKVRRMVSEG